LYPDWDWAWKKIEKSITRMGEKSTKVPEPVDEEHREGKKTV
jgi:hypothetical protein